MGQGQVGCMEWEEGNGSDGGKGEICGARFSVEGEARREGVMDGYCIQCLQHQATAYLREAAEVARNSLSDEQKASLSLKEGKFAIPATDLKLSKPFVAFVDENSELRGLIDTGKGDLQWERDIPPAALTNLESLASSDFTANLGKIIHDIYQTAHSMFSDMPQGDHKKRAKYRFASKTLMRILPAALKGQVAEAIEKKTITLDLTFESCR